MLTKNEIKYIQSLYQKKHRDKEDFFVVEGPKIAAEVLKSNYTIEKIYATSEWININDTDRHNIVTVTDDELKKISSLTTPNKVVMLIKKPILPVISSYNALVLVLDGIQDPGNFGSIIRLTDWFGIKEVLCSTDCADIYNPKVLQSTMGSFLRVNVTYTHDLAITIQQSKLPVYGALLCGTSIYAIPKVNNGFIIIGNEGKGIRENLLPLIEMPVTIPKLGGAESLNAAVATGIILSHLIKP